MRTKRRRSEDLQKSEFFNDSHETLHANVTIHNESSRKTLPRHVRRTRSFAEIRTGCSGGGAKWNNECECGKPPKRERRRPTSAEIPEVQRGNCARDFQTVRFGNAIVSCFFLTGFIALFTAEEYFPDTARSRKCLKRYFFFKFSLWVRS